MRLARMALFAMALGAGTLVAQSNGRSYGVACMGSMSPSQRSCPEPAVSQLPAYTLCPVSMQARRLAGGTVVKTGKAKPQGIGQWLHLTLISADARRIAKATLAIRGFSAKGRVAQATDRGESPDASTTVTAEFTAGPGRRDVADVWAPGMTAVQSIDVNSLVFVDGSTWKVDDRQTCRAAPDLFMPVANR